MAIRRAVPRREEDLGLLRCGHLQAVPYTYEEGAKQVHAPCNGLVGYHSVRGGAIVVFFDDTPFGAASGI